ncbi:hypothetical protein [Vibrio sp. 10N.239.312.D08]|uniref:hypothetical protein n=1 Tax=Vibrio sp. 10N.239.312.D08 TaxID=3229978 RepID=UPI00355073DB
MNYVLRVKTTGIESFTITGKTPDEAIYLSRDNLDVINPSYALLNEAEILLLQTVFNLDIEILRY